MIEEKEYTFCESRFSGDAESASDLKEVKVKESDLTYIHKNILIGQLIKDFNNLPGECQMKFLNLVIKDIEYKLKEDMINKFIKNDAI